MLYGLKRPKREWEWGDGERESHVNYRFICDWRQISINGAFFLLNLLFWLFFFFSWYLLYLLFCRSLSIQSCVAELRDRFQTIDVVSASAHRSDLYFFPITKLRKSKALAYRLGLKLENQIIFQYRDFCMITCMFFFRIFFYWRWGSDNSNFECRNSSY